MIEYEKESTVLKQGDRISVVALMRSYSNLYLPSQRYKIQVLLLGEACI